MNEATGGLIILSILSIVCSLVSHTLIRAMSLAIPLAAVFTAILFQVITYFQLGYLDPFFPITLVTTFAISFLIAIVIGVPFNIWGRNVHEKKHEST